MVSVIVPVYNDPEGVETTLDSLLAHTDYSGSFEIIVVDNGSTDRTRRVIESFASDYDQVELVVESTIQGSYAARNAGIERASGDVLVFLDADQRVTHGWLTTAIERMLDLDVAYLAPEVELDTGDASSLVGRYNERTGFPIRDFLEGHRYAPTSCLLVHRDLIDDVGVFDERLTSGGDLEFGNRVADAGYELGYAPGSTVIHPTRNSFRSLFGRNVRIGRGHCQLQRYYPERYGRVGIPPRPSGIRSKQVEADRSLGCHDRIAFTLIAAFMTAARGLGYYRECLSVLRDRLFDRA